MPGHVFYFVLEKIKGIDKSPPGDCRSVADTFQLLGCTGGKVFWCQTKLSKHAPADPGEQGIVHTHGTFLSAPPAHGTPVKALDHSIYIIFPELLRSNKSAEQFAACRIVFFVNRPQQIGSVCGKVFLFVCCLIQVALIRTRITACTGI